MLTVWLTEEIMRSIPYHLAAPFLGLASILTLGCGGDSNGPAAPEPTGQIEITVLTASESIYMDPDGYTVIVDDKPGPKVGVNATMTFGPLLGGTHLVRIGDLAANCSVTSANPVSVDVNTGGAASPVSFAVSCIPYSGGGYWDY
jgi:hypothetical protein